MAATFWLCLCGLALSAEFPPLEHLKGTETLQQVNLAVAEEKQILEQAEA